MKFVAIILASVLFFSCTNHPDFALRILPDSRKAAKAAGFKIRMMTDPLGKISMPSDNAMYKEYGDTTVDCWFSGDLLAQKSISFREANLIHRS